MEILDIKGKWGYTLIELIVVLALFAIVLCMAVPSTNIIFNTREKNELKTFRRDILFARNSAVAENCFYILALDGENNGYSISKESLIKGKQESVKVVRFKDGIKLKEIQLKNIITFKATGSPDQGTTINLSNKKKQKIEITIAPATGSVNLKIKK